jgi:hypothetical protein
MLLLSVKLDVDMYQINHQSACKRLTGDKQRVAGGLFSYHSSLSLVDGYRYKGAGDKKLILFHQHL